ncbi:MAG: hypothetical protein ACYTE3_16800 [Planctomycetota bacterium]
MNLLEPSLADLFLEQYKRLLAEVAGKPLAGIADSEYEPSFIDAVRNAQYGMFIYAKEYRQGYALKSKDNAWYFVTALTTGLEELVPDWVIIDTAVLPFHGQYVCDGLVVDRNVLIGKNMINEMIQELKVERPRWSSGVRPETDLS